MSGLQADEILCELIQPMKWPEFQRDKLLQRAKQIPRVLTNPGSYQHHDYPITGEFTD